MDLTKPPNKIFVYCVVGVVLFLWIIVWLFGPKPEQVQPGAPLDKMLVTLAQSGKQDKQEVEERKEDVVPGGWGRDPFYSPYQAAEETATTPQKVAKPKQESEQQGPQYKLSTVLVSGSKRLAVIDDRVYAVGDEIGRETIISITLDHVVLNGASGERLLEVPQPKTKVTVEGARNK